MQKHFKIAKAWVHTALVSAWNCSIWSVWVQAVAQESSLGKEGDDASKQAQENCLKDKDQARPTIWDSRDGCKGLKSPKSTSELDV